MFNKYYNYIARLCSLLVVVSACALFAKSIMPVLETHPNSDFIYYSKDGLEVFVKIFFAYFTLLFGILLINRSRLVWLTTLILTIGIIITNAVFWFNYVTFYINVGTLILLLVTYKVFDQDLFVSYGFIFICGFLLFALLYGTVGVYLFRSEFVGINSIYDAIYFTIVTYSTVGYGDIFPKTLFAKIFVVSMIIIGMVVFATSITVIAFNINKHLKKVLNHVNKGKFGMTNHIILIGYGIFTKILIEQYTREKLDFLVVDVDKNLDYDRQILMDNNKLLIAPYLGHNDTLVKSQAELAAKIIVGYDTDEATIFATMNTREYLDSKGLKVKPRIISRVFYKENIAKAKRAGADSVIAPHILAAQQIFNEQFIDPEEILK